MRSAPPKGERLKAWSGDRRPLLPPGARQADKTFWGAVVLIEAKAGDRVRSKSLARFAELCQPGQSLRLSTRQFGPLA